MKKQKDKKGFSLVELLAVVVILGILSVITIVSYNRYIKSSKSQYYKQMEKNAIMATKSYLQANKQYQPKNVGSVQNIYLSDLISSNYLKESDFSCDGGKKCNSDDLEKIDLDVDYVVVTKESNSKYKYEVSWNYNKDTELPYIREIISDDYVGDDASSLVFKSDLYGDNKTDNPNHKIRSYAYIVYVQYTGDTSFKEVYNSGYKSGSGKSHVSLNIDLGKYIKINQANDFKVALFVTNDAGNSISNPGISKSAIDNKEPYCIVENPVDSHDVLTKEELLAGKKRIIKAKCIDNGGSKCKKKEYTKIWDKNTKITDMCNLDPSIDNCNKYNFDINDEINHNDKDGLIILEDNKGNKSYNCVVDINIDNSKPDNEGPVIRLSADNGNGEHGFAMEEFKGQKNGAKPYVMDDVTKYDTQTNADNWLNSEWYPSGIFYDVDIYDESGIEKVTWATNADGLKPGDDSVNKMLSSLRKTYVPDGNGSESFVSKNEFKRNWQIGDDGARRGEIVAYDKKGNKTVVYVDSKIDHSSPNVPSAKIRENGPLGTVISNGPNPSSTQTYTKGLWWGNFSGNDAMSGYNHYEYSTECSETRSGDISDYRLANGYTYPLSGNTQNSCFRIRQIDNAGNSSSWSDKYKIKISIPTPQSGITAKTTNSWRVVYASSNGTPRTWCDSYCAKLSDGKCPSGVYGNIIGKIDVTVSNGNLTFDWNIINGVSWILNGYSVNIDVFYHDISTHETGSYVGTYNIKPTNGDPWSNYSSHSGTVLTNLPTGTYEVWFNGNPDDPSYDSYMGWFNYS